MSPWLLNVYMDVVMKEGEMGTREGGRLPGFLNTDDLVLSGGSEEDLRAMI